MTSEEIKRFQNATTPSTNSSIDQYEHCQLMTALTEIAYQLAVANEREKPKPLCSFTYQGDRCQREEYHQGAHVIVIATKYIPRENNE